MVKEEAAVEDVYSPKIPVELTPRTQTGTVAASKGLTVSTNNLLLTRQSSEDLQKGERER